MAYKNFFLATIFVTLLSLLNIVSVSAIEDAGDVIEESKKRSGFYVSGHWNMDGSIIVSQGGDTISWKGKENAPDLGKDSAGHVKGQTKNVRGWDKNGKFGNYKPMHVSSVVDYGAAVGYKWKNIRFEFEWVHFNLNVSEQGYRADKPAKYLELTRDWEDTPNGIQDNMKTLDPNLRGSGNIPAAFKMENKGFTTYAGIINAYYDADVWPIGLYAGIGLGIANVQFSVNDDKISNGGSFVAQVRGGGSYVLSPSTKFYMGIRALWTQCGFSGIKPAVAIKGSGDEKKSTTAYVGYHIYLITGLECGLMYNF